MKKVRGFVLVFSVLMLGLVLLLAGCSNAGSGTDPVDNGGGAPAANPAQSIKFGLEDNAGDANVPEIARPASGTLTTSWMEYEILFAEFTGEDPSVARTIKYVLPANNVEVHLDQIRLVDSSGSSPDFFLYRDGDDVDITPVWTFFGGYEGTINSSDGDGGADGTSKFLKLVGTGAKPWAAGGWGPETGSAQPATYDFSSWDKLVFSAKAPN